MNPPVIVVGVDGSAWSSAALKWAVGEAVRRDRELVVVHAYDWRVIGARAPIGGGYAEEMRAAAEELVNAAIADAQSLDPRVKVRGEVILGSAGPALVGSSKSAGLVVVGSRGRGGFTSLLLGSVSQQIATHAASPVVVVRGRPDIAGGPVVVGMDGSPSASYALGVAFDEAVARGAGIVAVRAYTPDFPPYGSRMTPYVENADERRVSEQKLLFDDLAPYQDKYPDITVEAVVVEGHPGRGAHRNLVHRPACRRRYPGARRIRRTAARLGRAAGAPPR